MNTTEDLGDGLKCIKTEDRPVFAGGRLVSGTRFSTRPKIMRFFTPLSFLLLPIGCNDSSPPQPAVSELSPVQATEETPDQEKTRIKEELSETWRRLTMDILSRRSNYEGFVAEAILAIDAHGKDDPQVKKIMEDNSDWYSLYRTCDSPLTYAKDGKRYMMFEEEITRSNMEPDRRRGAVHALVDFVEQYRQTKDIHLQTIEKRSTSEEHPTDSYKGAYKTFMGRVFDYAADPTSSDFVSLDLDHFSNDELKKIDDRYPLFPHGTRLKHERDEEKKEDDRLFGTPQ